MFDYSSSISFEFVSATRECKLIDGMQFYKSQEKKIYRGITFGSDPFDVFFLFIYLFVSIVCKHYLYFCIFNNKAYLACRYEISPLQRCNDFD